MTRTIEASATNGRISRVFIDDGQSETSLGRYTLLELSVNHKEIRIEVLKSNGPASRMTLVLPRGFVFEDGSGRMEIKPENRTIGFSGDYPRSLT